MEKHSRLKHISTLSHPFVVTRHLDPYVILDISIGKPSGQPPPLYWRLIDPDFNLIEIGIERDTGRLVSITVTFYNGELGHMERRELSDVVRTDVGVPSFSVDLWSKPTDLYDVSSDYYDVSGRGRLEIRDNDLRLALFPDQVEYRLSVCDDLICEFNRSDELCAVIITNLDSEEITALKAALKRT